MTQQNRAAIQTARPQRIPYNVAFREIVQFVITELAFE